jgi:mono/diheme cytochrome c family protein
MNDVRKWIFGAFLGLFLIVGLMLSIAYVSSCGLTFTCNQAAPKVERTSVPTLVPATLPASRPVRMPLIATPDDLAPDVARPSNPGGPGLAVGLNGNADSGAQIFVANCQTCHGEEGKGGVLNSGTDDGTVPPLNPIDDTLINSDYQIYATNLDLFIEHGSTPAGSIPNFVMPAWGDSKALTPQEIADVIAYVIRLNK